MGNTNVSASRNESEEAQRSLAAGQSAGQSGALRAHKNIVLGGETGDGVILGEMCGLWRAHGWLWPPTQQNDSSRTRAGHGMDRA
eukprot:SAG31_NODE_46256_length_255_cov_0.666667_1_plen_84_part_11